MFTHCKIKYNKLFKGMPTFAFLITYFLNG